MSTSPDGIDLASSGWVLRDDLLVRTTTDPPGCVVEDPLRGASYEFGPREHFLLLQLRRPHPSEEIAAKFSGTFGDACSAADVDGFRRMLADWHLLRSEDDPGGEIEAMLEEGAAAATDDPEAAAGPEYLATPNRLHLFDPRPMLDFFADILSIFRPLFVLSVPVLVVLGVTVMIRHYSAYMDSVELSTRQYGFIGKLLLTTITVNIFAQFVRGIYARQAGLNVPSFGIFMELGLIPRFNMQVVPSGPIPRKTRLWLSAMTPLCRMAAFGLGILIWRLAHPGSNLSLLGATIAGISLIGLIFSANPLWRTDGAAFFSALLDVPELRTRAQRMFWDSFRRKPPVLQRHGKRFRRLAIYGMLSIIFLYLAFGYIALDAFDRLEKNFDGAGVALWLAICAYAGYSIWRVQKAGREQARQRAQKPKPEGR
jgi:hypothetical protein